MVFGQVLERLVVQLLVSRVQHGFWDDDVGLPLLPAV